MSRVIRFHQFGPPEVLKCEELPTPAPAAGEVLVRVQAIGVSWKDVLWRQNLAPEQAALPSGLGFELAGKVPAADSPEIKALTVYAYWLASQAPTGVSLPGRGYPDVAPPEGGYSIERGAKVYAAQCAICHGADGQGQMALGQTVFPPLWGAQSFNWGAGMHRINTAASFIKYNMPLGKPGTLSDRDAWDVAAFMNSHERPQDPRLVDGSVEKTRQKFHANDGVNLYGQKVNGVLLGQGI